MGGEQEDLDALLARARAITSDHCDERWAIIRQIHGRSDRRAFDAACALARSGHPAEQVLGLDILAQIGYTQGRPFAGDTLPLLVQACRDEHPEILVSAIAALGHCGDPRGLAAVVRHAAHPDEDVRFAVAGALPMVAGDPPAAGAVSALIGLSADPDSDVRDWATFGLGSMLDEDSEPIRDALAARLDDPDGDTAGEALVGLARRHDPRALPVLLATLAGNPGNLIIEAAAELGAAEALPALRQLKRDGWQDHDPRPSILDDAIAACSPEPGENAK